jgi:hypothetical protein
MSDVLVLERITRNAALGLRFWDTPTATDLLDDLAVAVFPPANPLSRQPAVENPSGIYVAHKVPGLRAFEFGLNNPLAASPPDTVPRRIEVADPAGRFLPLAFDAALPAAGLFTFLAPWLSPPQPVSLPSLGGLAPLLLVERIPLFAAPARPLPEPLGVVYAQLRSDVSQQAAAWCLLGVSLDGVLCGLGLADVEGRVAAMFPFPEPPRRALASPPSAHDDFAWDLTLSAFWSPALRRTPPPSIPDLADVLDSLGTPINVIASRTPPAPSLRLSYRQPATVRTAGMAGPDASYLFVSA